MFDWLKPKRLPAYRIVEYADGRHVVEELFGHECGWSYSERAEFQSAEDARSDVRRRQLQRKIVSVADVA